MFVFWISFWTHNAVLCVLNIWNPDKKKEQGRLKTLRLVVLLMKPNEFEFSPCESFLWIFCCFCQSPNTSLLLTQNVRNGACGSHHYEKVSSEDLEVWGKWGWNFVQRPDADHESDKLWAKGPKRRFLDAIEEDKREGELLQEDDPLWWPL